MQNVASPAVSAPTNIFARWWNDASIRIPILVFVAARAQDRVLRRRGEPGMTHQQISVLRHTDPLRQQPLVAGRPAPEIVNAQQGGVLPEPMPVREPAERAAAERDLDFFVEREALSFLAATTEPFFTGAISALSDRRLATAAATSGCEINFRKNSGSADTANDPRFLKTLYRASPFPTSFFTRSRTVCVNSSVRSGEGTTCFGSSGRNLTTASTRGSPACVLSSCWINSGSVFVPDDIAGLFSLNTVSYYHG